MRGIDKKAVQRNSSVGASEIDRFFRAQRLYLETSAFNHFVDNFEIADIELTRAYQREKNVIFVTSPTMLWEIMLNTDQLRADKMLLAAQALFDPLLLATPTELVVRYLRHAYPVNRINYSCFTGLNWRNLWSDMTRDFSKTFAFNLADLTARTRPFRIISKNLNSVMCGANHADEAVSLAAKYVLEIYSALREDLETWNVDEITAKFVILYVFLLLIICSDLDRSEANGLWAEKGFTGDLEYAQVTRIFIDYPEIFVCGPVVEMAVMAASQFRAGHLNRGVLHDGMHMVYAPFVDAILSNDTAFLELSAKQPFYRNRVFHLSEIQFSRVKLPLSKYQNDQKSRLT